MATIKKAQLGYNFKLPKDAKAVSQKDRRPSYIQDADKSITNFTKKVSDKVSDDLKPKNVKKAVKNLKNFGKSLVGMKNGGSLTGLKASNKRVGPVDPKGAFTKVQKKTLAGAKGKASLTKDKQLGATKMAKRGMSIKKK